MIKIIIVFLLIPSFSFGQGKVDVIKKGNSNKIVKESVTNEKGRNKNSLQNRGNKVFYDKFVDTNNDGICDGRGRGLGFRFNYKKRKLDSINRKEK